MKKKFMTTDSIYEAVKKEIAILPCQEKCLYDLCALFAYHTKRNALLDTGCDADAIPYQSGLLVADTGSGKSFLIRSIAKQVDVNVIFIDGSSLSRDGWKGVTLNQQLGSALVSAGNIDELERSVIVIDEFDKMRLHFSGHDESNPQDNLLQLFNNQPIAVECGNKEIQHIDPGRLTVLFAGAFSGLDSIVKQRISPKASIGFSSASEKSLTFDEKNIIHQATTDDLEAYGIKRELLGRIGSIIHIDPMESEDYSLLLTAPNGSSRAKYDAFFSMSNGVHFDISESAVRFISVQGTKSGMGARAIYPIINDVMREAFTMVDKDESINKIILDANERGCYLAYEHGIRERSILDDNSSKSDQLYMLKENTLEELETVFCNLYQNADCDGDFDEYKTFIQLTLRFLKYSCDSSDYLLDSIVKIAKTTYKRDKGCNSTFDVMMGDFIAEPTTTEECKKLYADFKNNWDMHTTFRLTQAVNKILTCVEKEYQTTNIQFSII